MEFSAKQIAEYIQGTIVGDENATVHTFAKIERRYPRCNYLSYQILNIRISYMRLNRPLYWSIKISHLNMR